MCAGKRDPDMISFPCAVGALQRDLAEASSVCSLRRLLALQRSHFPLPGTLVKSDRKVPTNSPRFHVDFVKMLGLGKYKTVSR